MSATFNKNLLKNSSLVKTQLSKFFHLQYKDIKSFMIRFHDKQRKRN